MSKVNNLLTLLFFLVSNDFAYGVWHATSHPSLVSGLDPHVDHASIGEHPLAKIAIRKVVIALNESATIRVNSLLLGSKVTKGYLRDIFDFLQAKF